ncbi:hypothetical protein F2Q70_00039806 [Brassica cretica]|nr:hypothetical protein F2Q70_00039806 [Brassica cretica]
MINLLGVLTAVTCDDSGNDGMSHQWAATTPTSRGGDWTVAPKSRLCVRHDEVALGRRA